MSANRLERPRPPADLVTIAGLAGHDRFDPAPELTAWIQDAYLAETGPLYGEHHAHLNGARIGCLWTNAENTRKMRRVLAEVTMPGRSSGGGKWGKGRAEQQLRGWFGDIPDFLITFDAVYADEADDASFAALVDHELCHCAQDLDEAGGPKFNQDGDPVFTLKGHDLEEFVSVVRRFGIHAAGEQAQEFVIAAAAKPEIARAKLAAACGTCLRMVA